MLHAGRRSFTSKEPPNRPSNRSTGPVTIMSLHHQLTDSTGPAHPTQRTAPSPTPFRKQPYQLTQILRLVVTLREKCRSDSLEVLNEGLFVSSFVSSFLTSFLTHNASTFQTLLNNPTTSQPHYNSSKKLISQSQIHNHNAKKNLNNNSNQ